MRLLCSLMLLAGLIFASPARAASEAPRNYIAAIVNDAIITRGQVEEAAGGVIEPLLRTVSRPEMLAPKEVEALEQKIRGLLGETLDQMIENRLILDDFKTSGARVPDAIVDDEIKDRIRQHWHDRATLIKELNALGRTYDGFRQQVREEMILHYMRDKNVSSAILISPQKIERYYSTNLAQFQLGNQVRLRMIVLNCPGGTAVAEVRKMAQEISLKLDEGAAFSEMATIYSEGSQRKEGGDFGWREDSKYLTGLADIAKSLQPGQHSGVIGFARDPNDAYWLYQYDKAGQLVLGRRYTDKPDQLVEEKKFTSPLDEASLQTAPQEFRLMMVESRRVARTESLSEVRERIEKDLLVREKERLRKKWVERLRAKAFVRFF